MQIKTLIRIVSFAVTLALASQAAAQQAKPSPSPSPTATPAKTDDQERVRVFTEEVRLPVLAVDEYGHFDPSLEADDILVLEDGTPQQIKSVRHIPASVLILLDMGGEMSMAKSTKTTRDIALRLLARLKDGDSVSVMQFSERVELLQDWTTETDDVARVLRTKLSGGRRARLSEGIVAAVKQLKTTPAGSRHLVIVTDGVETPGGKTKFQEAVKQLVATQATVHVISYTALVRQAVNKRYKSSIFKPGTGEIKSGTVGADPTVPAATNRVMSATLATIDTDFEMRRWFKNYAKATEASEQRLTLLAAESGGRILLPQLAEDMVKQSDEVAREIGAQYVVTYRPTRPLSEAKPGEYRRIEIAARRVGLHLRTRRGYVATSP